MSAPDLSYEQARAELTGVVERLEAGGTTLEEALALWERGERLAEICQRWLDGARARLDAARTDANRREAPGGEPPAHGASGRAEPGQGVDRGEGDATGRGGGAGVPPPRR